MTENDELGVQLDSLAKEIIEEVKNLDGVTAKMDAFKILSAYWIGRTKIEAKTPPEEPGETFNDITKRIAATSSGG